MARVYKKSPVLVFPKIVVPSNAQGRIYAEAPVHRIYLIEPQGN